MPRPPRIDYPDALYHVTVRGNGRARIFFTDADRLRFLDQLQDNVVTASLLLYAFVLMDNHFHLLVRTPRANLSQFMQRLNTSYALYARFKHQQPGHQFESRFKAKLVEDDTYLAALTRYIHLNPVNTAACRRLEYDELVQVLEDYRWSSYPGYVDGNQTLEFVCYDILKMHSTRLAAARRQYRAYSHACLAGEDRTILDVLEASPYAIGSTAFVEETERRLDGFRTGRSQDEDIALPRIVYPIEEIDAAVAGHYEMELDDLKRHGHASGLAKFLAVELACRLTGQTQREIGEHYGGITSAAVSAIRRKIREGKYPLEALAEQMIRQLTGRLQS
jgi:putative transposase